MKWLFFLILPCGLLAAPAKVLVFDFGSVIADADYEPLIHFLSKTIDVTPPPQKTDANKAFKHALNWPFSYWEEHAGKQMSTQWIRNFEKYQNYLLIPIRGMAPLIQNLKDQGYQIVLLSNTSPARASFLESKGEYLPFQPVFLSCNLGVRKPDKRMYEIMLKAIDKAPQECIFVDDKKKNIKAAKELGIDGIRFRSAAQLKRELKKRGILYS